MQGVILPGRERVEIKEFERPDAGPGQVLVQMKASGLCGSDLRAIYNEHRTKPLTPAGEGRSSSPGRIHELQ